MRIVIADDHAIVREGLALLLERDGEFEVVGEAATGAAVLDQIRVTSPDVVLLDLRMPGMGGFEVLEALQGTEPSPAVIILTMHDDLALVRRAIQLGANGYLLKSVGKVELHRALRTVDAGKPYVQGDLTRPLIASLASDKGPSTRIELTTRQRTVLEQLAKGSDNREIATVLALSESSVKSELRRIYVSLGVTTRSEAVAVAFRLGILN
jgi:two-component system nitrate/nitrite response regulator NarL